LGQALTGGRTGYACWGLVGLFLGLVRWRRLLLWIPVVAVAVVAFLPGVTGRLLQGVGGTRGQIVDRSDDYEITSGRTLIWPYVIAKIKLGPLMGYGREAMVTTGLRDFLMTELDESFPHPHNAYLQLLLDNGLIGFLLVLPVYLAFFGHGLRLLLDRDDPLCPAVGGAAVALLLALFVGALGGCTFYPREGAVGMWAAMMLALRVSVERRWAQADGRPLFAVADKQEHDLEPSLVPPESALPALRRFPLVS